MSIRLYMDVHVPAVITASLRRRGVDVLTSQEDGTLETEDAELLRRATSLGRVLFSQDQDFLRLAAECQRTDIEFCAIVFAHQLGPGIGQIIEDLDLLVNVADELELRNQVIHLPLR